MFFFGGKAETHFLRACTSDDGLETTGMNGFQFLQVELEINCYTVIDACLCVWCANCPEVLLNLIFATYLACLQGRYVVS